jgi:quercetin dioxygenase-like cupin family protein
MAEPELPPLSSQTHSLQLPLEQDPDVGWKPHPLFRGSTPGIADIGCHVSILDPGRQPHDPHRHAEEEILIVLDGEAELVLEDGDQRAVRGTFAYYPTDFAHTLRNVSERPVTYAMFKWTTGHRKRAGALGNRVVPLADGHDAPKAFWTTAVLDGETRCLQHLHAHVTTLEPGAGYAAHADPYDVGIVVLEGLVETLGHRLGSHSVIFYAAGEPHGMENVGDERALYLVFEFHRRRSAGERLEDWLRRQRAGTR